ncbi:hypothetical protein [Bacillus subtilis]|uniref:hypothetical protein n=1 Tax=Bacillus subtilis TaxID=1423 RepID=UPI003D268238
MGVNCKMNKKKNNKKKNKEKKNIEEQNNEDLEELENAIYTYHKKELLAFFFEKTRIGHEKKEYKRFQSLLYKLDIECLEFAISRFSHIDIIHDHSKYVPAFIPLFAAYLTMFFNFYEKHWGALAFAAGTIAAIVWIIAVERKHRNQAISIMKIFEQVKERKVKDRFKD